MAYAFDTPLITTDQSIDRVLGAGLPVALVFLNGDPQPELEQAMKRLAREHAGQVLIVKVNVKDSPAVARRFEVTRTPAVAAVRGGQALAQAESIGEAALAGHVAYLLGRGPIPQTPRAPQAEPRSRPAQAGGLAGTGRPVAVTDATFDKWFCAPRSRFWWTSGRPGVARVV